MTALAAWHVQQFSSHNNGNAHFLNRIIQLRKQEGFLANEPCPFPVSTNIYICSSLKLTFLKYRTRTGFSKKKKKILVSGFDLIATINKVKKKVLIK